MGDGILKLTARFTALAESIEKNLVSLESKIHDELESGNIVCAECERHLGIMCQNASALSHSLLKLNNHLLKKRASVYEED